MRFPGPGDPLGGLHNTSCVFVCVVVCLAYIPLPHISVHFVPTRHTPTLGSEGGPGTMRFPGLGRREGRAQNDFRVPGIP